MLRTGPGVLPGGDDWPAVVLGDGVQRLLPILALLVAAGAGVALVQTPALTGAPAVADAPSALPVRSD